ncbi:collagen alpha-1(XIV) chain-like isoform X1 [Tachysurus ichikawai]
MQVRGIRALSPLLLLALTSLFIKPTHGQVSAPRRLRFKELGSGKLSVSWKEPKGEFDSYRFIYSSGPGEQERGVQVLKQDAKAVITDFDSSKEYSFKVYTVSGSQLSKPLLGTYKASRSEVSDRDPLTPSVKPDSEPEQGNEIIEGKVRPQSCRVKL